MYKIQVRKWGAGILAVILLSTVFVFVAPKPANALSYNFMFKIVSIFRQVKKYYDLYKNYSDPSQKLPFRVFPFGGRITHSEGGCAIKYNVWVTINVFGYPIPVPFTGVPIPIGGNTIEVGKPLKSPPGQLFTFPYVSDIYSNHNEDTPGVWALGLAFTPFPIKQINDVLGEITIRTDGQGLTTSCYIPSATPYVPYCYDNFRLECSKDNKNVILKLGTSGVQ